MRGKNEQLRMNFSRFISLPGEFEAEGRSRGAVSAEAAFAARNGFADAVKICWLRGTVGHALPAAAGRFQDRSSDG